MTAGGQEEHRADILLRPSTSPSPSPSPELFFFRKEKLNSDILLQTDETPNHFTHWKLPDLKG